MKRCSPLGLPFAVSLLSTSIIVSALATVAIADPTTHRSATSVTASAAPLAPISSRFAAADADEVPDFQRHVVPLLGRLGCNGRACHGSFQGRGGFQLSLFGYDFKADHDALLDENSGRVDVDDVGESLILAKPTDADMHDGGKRMDRDSWQFRVLQSWIEAGARYQTQRPQLLERLEVTPREIRFGQDSGDSASLRVVAHWRDGSAEDVTELCRFSTNDEAIAKIDQRGQVESGDPGDTHVVVYYDNAVVPVAVIRPIARDNTAVVSPPVSAHPIDQLIQAKLDKLNIVASPVCDDADFVRRVHLDLTGTLPSADQVKSFLNDRSSNKRARLIADLFETPEYAAWWATRFSDWTGNNEAQLNNVMPIRYTASKLWFAWLEKRLAENVPYDEIVAGIVTADSRMPGETYLEYCTAMTAACQPGGEELFAEREGLPQFWARQNFRLPEERAIGFAYTFLGIRIQCAQCHKHPFDEWSKDDFDQFAKLFTPIQARNNLVAPDAKKERDRLLEELTGGKQLKGGDLRRAIQAQAQEGAIVPFSELYVSVRQAKTKADKRPGKGSEKQTETVPRGRILGAEQPIELRGDPRGQLMEWLRSPENPYFAKAIVNRIWANHFGIGLVDPTDDMSLANPPNNAALLEFLAAGFVAESYDLQWLHRTILSSDAYQRSWQTNVTNVHDRNNFSHHIPRRLPAEVVHDAILLATTGQAGNAKMRRTLEGRAIAQPSPAYRNNNPADFSLTVFGRSIRETQCDCDRSDDPSLLQAIYLRNDTDIHKLLSAPNGWVAERCRQLGSTDPRATSDVADRGRQREVSVITARLDRQIARFEQLNQVQQQRQREQFDRGLKRARQRLTELSAELPLELERLLGVSPDDQAVLSATNQPSQTDQLSASVEDAYVRALSRYPRPAELATSLAFVEQAGTPAEGLEGLLWTLINTKEFILSH